MADYAGGYPTETKKVKDGGLAVENGGLVSFEITYANMIKGRNVLVEIPADELRAISAGPPGGFKGALGGALPIGDEFTGGLGVVFKGKTALLAAGERDGKRYIARFAVREASEAQNLLVALATHRQKLGLPHLPKIEEEGQYREQAAAQQEQQATLGEIRDMLRQQGEVLATIAQRLAI